MNFYNANFARDERTAYLVASDMLRNPAFAAVFPVLFVAKDGMLYCYQDAGNPRGGPVMECAYFTLRVDSSPSFETEDARVSALVAQGAKNRFDSCSL